MRFEIVGKNIEVTEAMREKIEAKLSALDKYLIIDDETIARVVARVYPNSQKNVKRLKLQYLVKLVYLELRLLMKTSM